MAPQKRSRRDREDEDMEIIDVQTASSSLRQDSQRKKARISNSIPQSHGTRQQSSSASSSEEESEEDQDDEMTEHHDNDAPPATQYEIIRDNGFSHLANQDDDDQLATQQFLARRQQIGENHAADNSIIEEITCINFMCHDKLHVELGPLINFVVGENGSGKSAVLTAITLCLGGKAASTNRGNSMKSLIKSGKEQAVLIVKLKNQGLDAYQPDTFGESIIVERHFSTSGSGSYKLKNATGRVISNKKTDVDDIVEYFQLQIDNPMNVLTQDLAKSFIQKSTPKEKFEFFNKGVQLAELDKDYKLVCEACDSIEEKLEDSKKDLKILAKTAEAAVAKSQMAMRHDGMRLQAKNFGKQLAWAQVESEEKKLAEREGKVVTSQENIDRQEGVIENKDAAYQQTHQLWEQAQEAERRVEAELQPLKAAVETARTAHETARSDVAKEHVESRKLGGQMKDQKAKVDAIKADIQAELARIEDVSGGSHARKIAEVEEAQQSARDAKDAEAEHKLGLPRIQQRITELDSVLKQSDTVLAAKRTETTNARAQLQSMQRDRGNPMKCFDNKMPNLLKLIGNERGFREKPVGPMGLHIKLLKQDWSHIIEKTIGSNLSGFVVACKSDQLILSRLMRQANLQSPILIGNKNPIDVSRNEPDQQYCTILRALDIDNGLVRNQLIINQGIEQCLLVERLEDAQRIMYEVNPKNVRQCFSLNPNKRGWGHRLARAGAGRDLQPMKPVFTPSKMQTDIASQIQYQTETVNGLQKELSDLEAKLRQAQMNLKTVKEEQTRHTRTLDTLHKAAQRADERVESLTTELERDNVEDGRLEALKVDLADAEQTLTITEEAYGNLAISKDALNQISSDKKRELDAVKDQMNDHEAKVKKAQHKTRNMEQARGIALQEKNTAISVLADLKVGKEELEQYRDRQITKIAAWKTEAHKISERVPVDPRETVESLNKKLKTLHTQLTRYKDQQGGSDEEIHNAAATAKERCATAQKMQVELEELLGILRRSFQKRMEMFRRFQRYISARSRINFTYLLSERAFRGKLTIDYPDKTLDVYVEPDETTKSGKGRQTKTLSGGEKSFSNICLLLSLWEAMGAPLRCLDEFDVFMDEVNRDVSSKMIVSAARRSVSRQFLLISPKGLGDGVDSAADVKIIKLARPREAITDHFHAV